MSESAIWTVRGAEISDRSEELILPEEKAAAEEEDDPDWIAAEPGEDASRTATAEIGEDAAWTAAAEGAAVPAAASALAAPVPGPPHGGARRAIPDPSATSLHVGWSEKERIDRDRKGGAVDETGTRDVRQPLAGRRTESRPTAATRASSAAPTPARETSEPGESRDDVRGTALPGDRGPARRETGGDQRPSFWRRIALGRRHTGHTGEEAPPDVGDEGALRRTRQIASRIAASATPLTPRSSPRSAPPPTAPPEAVAREVEKRIVEPMLQALVSVESKLERSHVDLLGRSDQIEQRLSQLWDIDEQLGALGDLQESLQRVSEQQRRLESAIRAQTRALRWVVGAVALSLAVAAFVVAALLP